MKKIIIVFLVATVGVSAYLVFLSKPRENEVTTSVQEKAKPSLLSEPLQENDLSISKYRDGITTRLPDDFTEAIVQPGQPFMTYGVEYEGTYTFSKITPDYTKLPNGKEGIKCVVKRWTLGSDGEYREIGASSESFGIGPLGVPMAVYHKNKQGLLERVTIKVFRDDESGKLRAIAKDEVLETSPSNRVVEIPQFPE